MARPFISLSTGMLVGGLIVGAMMPWARPAADTGGRTFEIRTYTVAGEKAPVLAKIFNERGLTKLFVKHGMETVGFWLPQDEPQSKNTFIYVLAHKNRADADKNWNSLKADPELKKFSEYERSIGVNVEKVAVVFASPTDYSALK